MGHSVFWAPVPACPLWLYQSACCISGQVQFLSLSRWTGGADEEKLPHSPGACSQASVPVLTNLEAIHLANGRAEKKVTQRHFLITGQWVVLRPFCGLGPWKQPYLSGGRLELYLKNRGAARVDLRGTCPGHYTEGMVVQDCRSDSAIVVKEAQAVKGSHFWVLSPHPPFFLCAHTHSFSCGSFPSP